MYFISDEDGPVKKSDIAESKPIVELKSVTALSADEVVNARPDEVSNENNSISKRRVYGRARANLSFSSFYIFCEDFRQQLDHLFAHESEAYRKNM